MTMWQALRVCVALFVVGLMAPAIAADLDNNGIDGDETHVPGNV